VNNEDKYKKLEKIFYLDEYWIDYNVKNSYWLYDKDMMKIDLSINDIVVVVGLNNEDVLMNQYDEIYFENDF
jgi:hypothetical protein